jgi:iron only hydrogenase large subunit-like protein
MGNSKPKQKSHYPTIHTLRLGVAVLACNLSCSEGGLQSEAGQAKSKRLSKKQTKSKRTKGVAQVGECLPSKHEA